jgi:hypothetical protein
MVLNWSQGRRPACVEFFRGAVRVRSAYLFSIAPALSGNSLKRGGAKDGGSGRGVTLALLATRNKVSQ